MSGTNKDPRPPADRSSNFDKEQLRRLRVEERLSYEQIAQRLDSRRWDVERACERWGINLREQSEAERNLDPTIHD